MMLSHTTSAPFLQYSSTGIITGILKLLKAKGIPVNTRCIIARAASEEASSREVQQDGKLQPAKTQSSPPKLVNVPALPFVGSLVTMHSGFTQWNLDQPYLHFLSNREKFGDFYSLGLPGIGVGIFARLYLLTDANEYMKVLRQEGQFPFGGIQLQWPNIVYFQSIHSPLMDEENGYFGQGLTWKRQRTFLQADLLSPSAAKGYTAGIVMSAEIASKRLPEFRSNVNQYMGRCSFDMFSSVLFGCLTKTSSPKEDIDPEDIKFCNASMEAVESVFPLIQKPHLRLLLKLGLKPADYKRFEDNLTISRNIANAKLEALRKRKEHQDLTEVEQASYFSRSIDRLNAEPKLLSYEELAEIICFLLIASVATTSSLLNWCIVHLAMNPIVQDELFQEISSNLKKSEEGRISEAIISKSSSPFLHAVVRESHRMTPATCLSLLKSNTQADVVLHGYTIPKGSMILLDTYSLGMDPAYVSDFNTFRPQRWFDEEVQMRFGTPAEMIDHPLYRDPFSAGSRKCPGSRVANLEALVMISQLVLDWKFVFEDESIKSLDGIQKSDGLTIQPKVPTLKVCSRSQE